MSKIDRISGGKRTLAALNAEFTPTRSVEVEFNGLDLPDGRHLQLQTNVATSAGECIPKEYCYGNWNWAAELIRIDKMQSSKSQKATT